MPTITKTRRDEWDLVQQLRRVGCTIWYWWIKSKYHPQRSKSLHQPPWSSWINWKRTPGIILGWLLGTLASSIIIHRTLPFLSFDVRKCWSRYATISCAQRWATLPFTLQRPCSKIGLWSTIQFSSWWHHDFLHVKICHQTSSNIKGWWYPFSRWD